MQKFRPKTVHTAANDNAAGKKEDAISSEPQSEDAIESKAQSKTKKQDVEARDEVEFRHAEDFKQLDRDLEIVKDKKGSGDSEAEKVFITKTEKKCLEDIGNLASRVRPPLDDKHQKFFEKDRRRFVDRIIMPETQECDKSKPIPPDIISKTMEVPVNITNTELDGLRSYLLQLKALIARREMAWARTTERDYNQRVEITRFKNEVNHLRMLCEKRQKDIKERDEIISAKEDEIKELQKKVQGLRNAMSKLERKDDRTNDAPDGVTNEVLENSHLMQRPYSMMRKVALINKTGGGTGPSSDKTRYISTQPFTSANANKQTKQLPDKAVGGKFASGSSFDHDVDARPPKTRNAEEHREENPKIERKSSVEKLDEKLQRIGDMLHLDLHNAEKKTKKHTGKVLKTRGEPCPRTSEVDPTAEKKFTLSNGKMRQEMLGAVTGLASNISLGMNASSFPVPKISQGNSSALANALLAARNTKMFKI